MCVCVWVSQMGCSDSRGLQTAFLTGRRGRRGQWRGDRLAGGVNERMWPPLVFVSLSVSLSSSSPSSSFPPSPLLSGSTAPRRTEGWWTNKQRQFQTLIEPVFHPSEVTAEVVYFISPLQRPSLEPFLVMLLLCIVSVIL